MTHAEKGLRVEESGLGQPGARSRLAPCGGAFDPEGARAGRGG
jgi:hypothetical protein